MPTATARAATAARAAREMEKAMLMIVYSKLKNLCKVGL
jgi:hypothetical protein